MDLHVYYFSEVTKVDLTALFLKVLNTFATQPLYTAFKERGDVIQKCAWTSLETPICILSTSSGIFCFNFFLNMLCGVARKPVLADTHTGETQVSLSFEKVIQASENNRK